MNKKWFLWLSIFLMEIFLMAEFKPTQIESFVLKNGLKVILYSDSNQSQIAYYTFFRVGSRNERPGLTGVSHFIEHMMFNGSEHFGPGEFDRIMEDAGGANNAYTGQDFTAYTDWFPPQALEKMVALEADRMQGLIFQPEVLESERGVVASERRLSEDDHESMLLELLQATAIVAHPYHWSVIGWMSDILNWKREEILNYYRTYYAPNNAVIVVCGSFSSVKLKKLITEHYEKISPASYIPAVHTVEPIQQGERRIKLLRRSKTGMLILAYPTVQVRHADFFPLFFLSRILAGGRSSRLYQRLVEKEQLAFRVNVNFEESFDPYLIFFTVFTADDQNYSRIEAIIEEEFQRLINDGVKPEELEKVRNQSLANFYRSLQTLAGKANQLGQSEMLYGDFNHLFEYDRLLEKVSAEDVRRVARNYLLPERKNVAELIQQGEQK